MSRTGNSEGRDKQCRRWECIEVAELGVVYQGYCKQHKPPMFQRRGGYDHYHTPRPGNWAQIRDKKIRQAIANKEACEHCGEPILKGQDLDLDHRDTKRGKDIHDEDNLRVLHRPCHAKVTHTASRDSKQQRLSLIHI